MQQTSEQIYFMIPVRDLGQNCFRTNKFLVISYVKTGEMHTMQRTVIWPNAEYQIFGQ